jgi:hypothetical protein
LDPALLSGGYGKPNATEHMDEDDKNNPHHAHFKVNLEIF